MSLYSGKLLRSSRSQWADPGLQDQVLLGAPRTFELAASAKW
jgi:hypothetical protein